MSFKTGYAYFTDWRLGAIVRVRKSDGGEMTIIRRGISNIMHVKAYDAHSQIGELICCADEKHKIWNKRQNIRKVDFCFLFQKWCCWITTVTCARPSTSAYSLRFHISVFCDYMQFFSTISITVFNNIVKWKYDSIVFCVILSITTLYLSFSGRSFS